MSEQEIPPPKDDRPPEFGWHTCPDCDGYSLTDPHDLPCALCGMKGSVTTWQAVEWLLARVR